jgi:ATP-dependent Clp protease ATP-binding subunit ClpA
LETCPTSLIIIDDVQYIHSSTLVVLQQFMDNQDYIVKKDGKKVAKNRAFLGVISDFAREGLSANGTLEQLEEMVYNHMKELWDLDPKQSQLIQYIFPFASLQDNHIEDIIKFEVKELLFQSDEFKGKVRHFEITDEALKWMRINVRKKYPSENGRGVKKYVSKLLFPLIEDASKGVIPYWNVKIDIDKSRNNVSVKISNYQDNGLRFEL